MVRHCTMHAQGALMAHNLKKVRANEAGVVGLHGQDAGGGRQVGLVGDQCSGALVGGDTHVLEDEGAKQEEVVVGVPRIPAHPITQMIIQETRLQEVRPAWPLTIS